MAAQIKADQRNRVANKKEKRDAVITVNLCAIRDSAAELTA